MHRKFINGDYYFFILLKSNMAYVLLTLMVTSVCYSIYKYLSQANVEYYNKKRDKRTADDIMHSHL
jgi:hypothetical protein